jgi:putative endonuclease
LSERGDRREELLGLHHDRSYENLVVGVTNDIERRAHEHKNKSVPGFTSKYSLDRLVYFEEHRDIRVAIEREKQIKSWRREKKVVLIESVNPGWRNLSLDCV